MCEAMETGLLLAGLKYQLQPKSPPRRVYNSLCCGSGSFGFKSVFWGSRGGALSPLELDQAPEKSWCHTRNSKLFFFLNKYKLFQAFWVDPVLLQTSHPTIGGVQQKGPESS